MTSTEFIEGTIVIVARWVKLGVEIFGALVPVSSRSACARPSCSFTTGTPAEFTTVGLAPIVAFAPAPLKHSP